jgi:Protein of unknown function (DUF3396)
MSGELHTISRAVADLRTRLGFVVFVRGSLRAHGEALEDLWTRLQAGLLRKRFTRYRLASQTSWTPLPESTPSGFAALFGMRGPLVGYWGLELAETGNQRGDGPSSLWLQLSDLAPLRGVERASHVRVLFPDDTPETTVAGLGEWAINRLPLWWGSGGYVFHHTAGPAFTAHTRLAALAKRYWGVQIQDLTSLQWDGLKGMPGVNWLTLIGEEFAGCQGLTIEGLATAAKTEVGLSHRLGPNAVAIAAGPEPLNGDLNAGEDLDAYLRVARLLQPFLLTQHTPLAGPFAKPAVLSAWLGRFNNPQAWLDCDIRA